MLRTATLRLYPLDRSVGAVHVRENLAGAFRQQPCADTRANGCGVDLLPAVSRPDGTAAVERDDDGVHLDVGSFGRRRQSADGRLTSSAESAHDRALGSQRIKCTVIVDPRPDRAHLIVVGPN